MKCTKKRSTFSWNLKEFQCEFHFQWKCTKIQSTYFWVTFSAHLFTFTTLIHLVILKSDVKIFNKLTKQLKHIAKRWIFETNLESLRSWELGAIIWGWTIESIRIVEPAWKDVLKLGQFYLMLLGDVNFVIVIANAVKELDSFIWNHVDWIEDGWTHNCILVGKCTTNVKSRGSLL